MKYLKITIAVLCLLMAGFYVIIYNNQENQFLGTPLPENYRFNFTTTFQEVNIPWPGGKIINAVLLKAKKPKGIVIFFHGGGGNLLIAQEAGKPFIDAGYDFMAFDYPGYGKTTVAPSSQSFYSVSQQIYLYSKNLYPEHKTILYGRSLGSAMAARVAATNHPAKLILGSPVYERGGLASQLPDWAAAIFKFIFPKSVQYEFKTHADIDNIKCPITIFCGGQENDCADSQKLLILNNKVSLVSITNANHSSILTDSVYLNLLVRQLNQARFR